VEIRSLIRKGKITLESLLEHVGDLEAYVRKAVLAIYKELFVPIRMNKEREFIESISCKETILVSLRVKEDYKRIVGYVKGGPLESYTLRQGTLDENYGRDNSVFMEWISIRPGYWGQGGGHLLRMEFLNEAKKRGYNFATSYVHRNVIVRRIDAGERLVLVQKYDPDKLDYYRTDLHGSSFIIGTADRTLANIEALGLEAKISALE
ncbi:MAG: GNAT family N-acetyltransferase, partial [Nitrososphaeraceae archaeon]